MGKSTEDNITNKDNNLFSSIKTYLADTQKPFKWEWVVFLVLSLILLQNNFYYDITATAKDGVIFWQSLFSGKLLNFYSSGTAYPITIYLFFAVWNLPVYLIQLIFGVDAFSSFLIVPYEKIFIFLAFIVSIKVFEKICVELGFDKQRISWAKYLYFTSAVVMYNLVIIGQYDIFSVIFSMLGILAYMRKDNKKFMLYFAIAVTLKYFSLLIFLALLLLQEKKILKILGKTALLLSPLLFLTRYGLIFRWGADSVANAAPTLEKQEILEMFTSGYLDLGIFKISYFLLALVVFYIICYVIKIKDAYDLKTYAIYMCALCYTIFLTMTPVHPFWHIIATPYVTLLLLMNKSAFKLNILLETIWTFCLIFVQQTVAYTWCAGFKTFLPTFWSKIIALPDNALDLINNSLLYFISGADGLHYLSIAVNMLFGSICVAVIIAFFILNTPNKIKAAETGIIEIERGVIWLRSACSLFLGILPLIVFFANMNIIL